MKFSYMVHYHLAVFGTMHITLTMLLSCVCGGILVNLVSIVHANNYYCISVNKCFIEVLTVHVSNCAVAK